MKTSQAILDAADRYGRERLAPLAKRMDDEEWWPDEELFGHSASEGLSRDYGTHRPRRCRPRSIRERAGVARLFSMELRTRSVLDCTRESLSEQHSSETEAAEQCVSGTYRAYPVDAFAHRLSRISRSRVLVRMPWARWRRPPSETVTTTSSTAAKLFITNGPVADICLLYVKTDMSSKGIARASRHSCGRDEQHPGSSSRTETHQDGLPWVSDSRGACFRRLPCPRGQRRSEKSQRGR